MTVPKATEHYNKSIITDFELRPAQIRQFLVQIMIHHVIGYGSKQEETVHNTLLKLQTV